MPKSVCLSLHIRWGTTTRTWALKWGWHSVTQIKEMCLWFLKLHWLIGQELQLTSKGSVHVTLGKGREEGSKKDRKRGGVMLTSLPASSFLCLQPCVDPQGSFYLSQACHQRRRSEWSRGEFSLYVSMGHSQNPGLMVLQGTEAPRNISPRKWMLSAFVGGGREGESRECLGLWIS